MAATFQIMGPCRIHIAVAGGSTSELGETDNEDLIEFEIEENRHDVHTVTSGVEIVTAVFMGRRGTLSFTLNKWDTALELWKGAPGDAATAGLPGVVGTRYITGSEYFKVEIRRVAAESTEDIGYTFGRCLLREYRVFDFGNKEKRMAVEFAVTRDGSTGNLADGSSATADLWTPITS